MSGYLKGINLFSDKYVQRCNKVLPVKLTNALI